MIARAPASSANLGPGFDTLAIALALYVEVSVEPADQFSIETEGCGAGRFDDERHLAARVARGVLGHDRFALHVNSSIPLSRGLGSSAALAIAAAAAAGASDPLAVAADIDGHAENAAASVLGGFVVASRSEEHGVVARRLDLDEVWRFVVVVPDEELSTADARRALPTSVSFGDVVANLNAMGLLIAGLAHHDDFVDWSMDDALHQPYRAGLLSFADGLLARLRESGAAASSWSGAGPSMLGLVTNETADDVALAAKEFLHARSIPGEVYLLDADRAGLVIR
ncbi:MAG TPA: homoserine kinase [Acidimicrobiales bacterium]|nr:homoserine kinase [Acidimicrobiales bacterium]